MINKRAATRDGFGDALLEYGNDNIIVLSTDLAKPTCVDKYKNIIHMGISESNAIGVAAGLSSYGFKSIVTSFASFLTGRYDQIRCSLAYPNLPCLLVGTHGGLAIGRDGTTQMGLEDINLMRCLPNMTVIQPVDYLEAYNITRLILTENFTLTYLRLGRQPVNPILNNFEYSDIRIIHKSFSGKIIITTGAVCQESISIAEKLNYCLLHITKLYPFNKALMNKICDDYNIHTINTIEDHSVVGGLGTIISEYISQNNKNIKLRCIGINGFGESGKPEDLYKKYLLDTNGIQQQLI